MLDNVNVKIQKHSKTETPKLYRVFLIAHGDFITDGNKYLLPNNYKNALMSAFRMSHDKAKTIIQASLIKGSEFIAEMSYELAEERSNQVNRSLRSTLPAKDAKAMEVTFCPY